MNSLPICIKKNAFGENSPFQDLYVSPQHSLLFNGKMVFASSLINGDTIYPDNLIEEVEYYHLECRQYCVIFANGVLGESYFDAKNRYVFSFSQKLLC